MFFDILTLFPDMFAGAFADSIISRAVEKQIVSITLTNIRDFSTDRHRSVDEYPFGGDAGMLMAPQPVDAAIRASKERLAQHNPCVVYLSPSGEKLTHAVVEDLTRQQSLILLCGRYKGVDQRVIDKQVDREISIGDYVLSGGEIPAMVIVDAVTRLLPGSLGNRESAERDSFYCGLVSPPQYTRPEIWEDMAVPSVLVSGHHEKIRQWQLEQAIALTQKRRPDLWNEYQKSNRK